MDFNCTFMKHMMIEDESNSKVTVEFETVTIDTNVYLPYLLSSFLAKGGRIVRTRVGHVSQVAQGSYTPSKPGEFAPPGSDALVNIRSRCNCGMRWTRGTIVRRS
jgi:hypothetical protein